MAEAYGITGVRPRNTRHGVWAAAIQKMLERRPAARAAAGELAVDGCRSGKRGDRQGTSGA